MPSTATTARTVQPSQQLTTADSTTTVAAVDDSASTGSFDFSEPVMIDHQTRDIVIATVVVVVVVNAALAIVIYWLAVRAFSCISFILYLRGGGWYVTEATRGERL